MRTNRIYGLCALQLIGLGVQVINRMAGNFIIFICSAGIILYAVKLDIEQRKFKICPKCKMKIPKKTRICPECGYQYGPSVREEELTDMIEHRRDEEEAYSEDRIDCDFEKIEEVAVDTFTLFDGDIQEFLDGREDTEEILTAKQENTGKM